MRIEIATALLDGLRARAAAAPGREICGLLFGSSGRIDEARATDNVAADPATGFEIDPRALFAAYRAARAGGPAVVGCYHSHPTGRAEPSARDRAGATPGQYWLILAGDTTALYLAGAAGQFDVCAMTAT